MNIIKDLTETANQLKILKSDFNNQLNSVDDNISEFHKLLIPLSKKYPEQTELVEFIVMIRDDIDTNQSDVREILNNSINELISIKLQLLKYLIDYKETEAHNHKFSTKFLKSISSMKDIKSILVLLIILISIITVLLKPNKTIETIEVIKNMENIKPIKSIGGP